MVTSHEQTCHAGVVNYCLHNAGMLRLLQLCHADKAELCLNGGQMQSILKHQCKMMMWPHVSNILMTSLKHLQVSGSSRNDLPLLLSVPDDTSISLPSIHILLTAA